MIPQGVKMSNGASSSPKTDISAVLRTPLRGPSSRIQPSAAMKLGAAKVSTALPRKNRRIGMSVRTASQATGRPRARQPRTVPQAIHSELRIASISRGSLPSSP